MSGFGSRTPELPNQHLRKAYIHPINFVAHDSLLLAPDVDSRFVEVISAFSCNIQQPALMLEELSLLPALGRYGSTDLVCPA